MPNRMIKETIHESEKLNSLSDFNFRLWVYLLTFVDDYGRGDARPKIIKGNCFPLRDRVTVNDIDAGLHALADTGCISLYEVGGKPYLCFPSWGKHQRIQTKRSRYPEPPEIDELHGNPPSSTVTHGESPSEIEIEEEVEEELEGEIENTISAEASSAPVAALMLLDGSQWEISQEDAEKDAQAYPAVDVLQEYLQMARWLDANPKKRKTRNGIKRFINSWLERAQNSGRKHAGGQTYVESKIQAFANDIMGGKFHDAG